MCSSDLAESGASEVGEIKDVRACGPPALVMESGASTTHGVMKMGARGPPALVSGSGALHKKKNLTQVRNNLEDKIENLEIKRMNLELKKNLEQKKENLEQKRKIPEQKAWSQGGANTELEEVTDMTAGSDLVDSPGLRGRPHSRGRRRRR